LRFELFSRRFLVLDTDEFVCKIRFNEVDFPSGFQNQSADEDRFRLLVHHRIYKQMQRIGVRQSRLLSICSSVGALFSTSLRSRHSVLFFHYAWLLRQLRFCSNL
jgi:hypothetical protein